MVASPSKMDVLRTILNTLNKNAVEEKLCEKYKLKQNQKQKILHTFKDGLKHDLKPRQRKTSI